MEPPSWLDKQLLASALKVTCKGRVDIVHFTIKPAVPPGSNYLSLTFRVEVKYQVEESGVKSISIIVKAPTEHLIKELPENAYFYSREPKIYKNLLHIIQKKISYEFSPKYYPCSMEGGMILQDLKKEGYVMCDRFKQLDFAHCKEVLTVLAKFHAASVACHQENPNLVETLGKEVLYIKEGPFKYTVGNSFRNILHYAKTLDIPEEFFDLILNQRSDEFWESSVKLLTPRPLKINVLNHGDLWTTNILFKHTNEGDIEGVKFVDYQLTRYGSPVSDLAFFIWSSGNEVVRELRQEELYNIYRQTLNKTFKELGCKERYSKEDLHEDLKGAAAFVLVVICNFLPVFMADPEDGAIKLEDLDSTDNNEMVQKLLGGKYFKHIIPNVAKQYMKFFRS